MSGIEEVANKAIYDLMLWIPPVIVFWYRVLLGRKKIKSFLARKQGNNAAIDLFTVFKKRSNNIKDNSCSNQTSEQK